MTSEEIRVWRQARGVGVRELARLLGVDKAQIVRWEKGETRPPAMLRLALVGVDAERRAGGDGGDADPPAGVC